jgi:hypothetical protein
MALSMKTTQSGYTRNVPKTVREPLKHAVLFVLQKQMVALIYEKVDL